MLPSVVSRPAPVLCCSLSPKTPWGKERRQRSVLALLGMATCASQNQATLGRRSGPPMLHPEPCGLSITCELCSPTTLCCESCSSAWCREGMLSITAAGKATMGCGHCIWRSSSFCCSSASLLSPHLLQILSVSSSGPACFTKSPCRTLCTSPCPGRSSV